MNMIACDETCQHQKDGYCTLNHITSLSSETATKCGYYEAVEKNSFHTVKPAKNEYHF